MRRVGADPEQLFDRQETQVIDRQGFRLSLPKLPAPSTWPGAAEQSERQLAENTHAVVDGRHQAPGIPAAARHASVAAWPMTRARPAPCAGTSGNRLPGRLNTPVTRGLGATVRQRAARQPGAAQGGKTPTSCCRCRFRPFAARPAGRWLQALGRGRALGLPRATATAEPDCLVIDGERFAAAIPRHGAPTRRQLRPACATDYAFEPVRRFTCNSAPALPGLSAPQSAGPPTGGGGRPGTACRLRGERPAATGRRCRR